MDAGQSISYHLKFFRQHRGAESKRNKINDIHNKLENEFDHAKIGETPRKRNFRPHILLGKYKNGNFFAPDEPVAASARAHFKVTELEARSLSLFKSELLPTGAKHTELA